MPHSSAGQTESSALGLRLAALTAQERLSALESNAEGLSSAEAATRLASAGWNDPVRPTATRHVFAIARQFTHTLALLLWFAAGLAFAAGLNELGAAVIAVIVINGVFAAAQEYRAEQLVEGLMRRVAVHARVLRDGAERVVPARELVRGDIVMLRAGDIVPADCTLTAGEGMTLDLSTITGETTPVARGAEPAIVSPELHVSEVACIAPAGSAVITGSASALVWATGPASTLGQIAALVESVERGESILERQVAALSWTTAVIAVLIGAATLGLATVFTETSFVAALTFATGVIVALVPEGLLPTLSVALAIGAGRMAEQGAAVRRLSAVEIIGSATVICTDKTGTLTENALSVLGVLSARGTEGERDGLLAAVLCNDARPASDDLSGDPIDVALAMWARDNGVDLVTAQAQHRRLDEIPFDAHRRYMAVTCEVPGGPRQFLKGAPEAVVSALGVELPAAFEAAIEEAATLGERVLMLGSSGSDGSGRIEGLVRLYDPPRAEVPAAIAACRRAGIRVVMLTGDHPGTARSVAERVGLDEGDIPVIEGAALDTMGDLAVLRVLQRNAIFARIYPEQKLRIVTLLRGAGDVVAVTGDGINDAPALRAADVGVAMGRRGTEVAKQAADIVLADDNFATLVAAIEEGRSLKRNIRRFISYVFTSNVAEVMPFLCYIFLPVPLPLAVIQALAIDVGTDLVPALALGAEAPAAGTMDAPPEPPRRPLLTQALAVRTFFFFGLVEAALGLVAFVVFYLYQGWRPFDDFDAYISVARQASTLTFLGIVGGQIGCLFAQRDGSLWTRLSLRSNMLLGVGLLSELMIAPALVYVPGLNGMFSMAAVNPLWLLVVPASAVVFLTADVGRRRIVRSISGRLSAADSR